MTSNQLRPGQQQTEVPRGEPFAAPLPPAAPTTVAVIEGIATGNPAGSFDQATAAQFVADHFGAADQIERIARIYEKTKIANRQLAVSPLDDEFRALSERPGTIRERMNLFYEHGVPLAVEVAGNALADADAVAEDIGLVVFVTSTGLIAPGVDVAVVRGLGLAPTVHRVVINFMGCAAAMNGIRTASDFVRANPDRKALVVCIELSSVNAVFADSVNDIVIHSLFGDGCGAVVVGAGAVQQPLSPGKLVVRTMFSHLLDGAEDGIVLGINPDGITCDLSVNLPDYILAGVGPAIDAVLAENDLDRAAIDLWGIHPGGPKIISESSKSLGLAEDAVPVSWEVLAEYGNMLSVALIFVLQRMVARELDPAGTPGAKPVSTGVAFSFAPGVTLEGLIFDVVRA